MLSALAGPILGIIDKVVPDRDAKERAKEALLEMEASGELAAQMAQIKVNEASAAHHSLFVAGARPAAIWLCVLVLAYHFMLADWAIYMFPGYVPASVDGLENMLIGLLGLGGLRTFEKMKGVARER